MKKTIIIILVLGLVFVAKFCTNTVDVIETKGLEGTTCSIATIKIGDETSYALAHGQKLINDERYKEIYMEHGIIIAFNNQGYHFYTSDGNMINNMYYTGYMTTKNYAILQSKLGEYIYNQNNDMLSSPYKTIIPQADEFMVEDVNGWGVLDKDLECIVPTEYGSLSQLPKH